MESECIEETDQIKSVEGNEDVDKSLDQDDSEDTEKIEEETVTAFKKPVLLIGPRKGLHKFTKIRTTKIAEEEKEQQTVIKEPETTTTTTTEKILKSPAELLNDQNTPVPYKEAPWGCLPDRNYSLEVLKSGSIVETHQLSGKSYFIFGRSTGCDIVLAHPSISRFHAILQFGSQDDGSPGFHLYDLSSTHGTFLNRRQIKPHVHARIQVGHMIKLGLSTRFFILQGPADDEEPESEFTVTELMEKRRKEKLALELAKKEEEERKKREEAEGISWGMADDAEEEPDLSVNPYAVAPNEDLYVDDPKKTLRGWFEREGHDLHYDVQEKGYGQFTCRVQLPVDDAEGRPLAAEVSVKGKKKEAVIQCALEACRILDRQGLLRQATHESRKRKMKNWEENDYYDSDEDVYLDRTGTVERKREARMKQAGSKPGQPVVHTYPGLIKEHTRILSEIHRIEDEIQQCLKLKEKTDDKRERKMEHEDDLDAYMSSLKDEKTPSMANVSKLKSDLAKLRLEEGRIRNLANIARPAGTAELPPLVVSTILPSDKPTKSFLPLVGKRPRPLDKLKKLAKPIPVTSQQNTNVDAENEEELDSDSE